jgi:hypothetical protein
MVYKNVELKRQAANRERKEFYIKIMGGKCVICGYDKNPACFDFHHIDPTLKDHEPKQVLRCRDHEIIMAELAKCVLVCKNCHADIHHPLPQEAEICTAP